MRITEYFGIKNNGHIDLAFVDTDGYYDVNVGIDAMLIKGTDSVLAKECYQTIKSFIDCVLEACFNRDMIKLNYLFGNCGEINATHLGMSQFESRGKGASREILMKVFENFIEIDFLKHIKNASDISLFAQNFGLDRMSDLITNIILKHLYDFTIEQSRKYDLKLSDNQVIIGKYWCPKDLEWKSLYGNALLVNNKNLLMVPKQFVSKTPICNCSQYLNMEILNYLIKLNYDRKSKLSYRLDKNGRYFHCKPFKKDVRAVEVSGKNHKLFISKVTMGNPDLHDNYYSRKLIEVQNGEKYMTDRELDKITQRKQENIA